MAMKKSEVAQKAYDAYCDFFNLCKVLFGQNMPENINQLDKTTPYYEVAQAIAKEFEMDWNDLTPEDSDEIELALLDEYYNRINVDSKYAFTLNITVAKKKTAEKKGE